MQHVAMIILLESVSEDKQRGYGANLADSTMGLQILIAKGNL
jgi:hypothetical protein